MIIQKLNLLLTALSNGDKAAFLSISSSEFAKVAATQFDGISQNISSRLKSGYTIKHLDDIKRATCQAAVFKIIFEDFADELIAYVSVTNGSISGFLLK